MVYLLGSLARFLLVRRDSSRSPRRREEERVDVLPSFWIAGSNDMPDMNVSFLAYCRGREFN